MRCKNKKQKKVVYFVLAAPYITDPRVKQEVTTLNKNGFYSYVLSWDREGKYPDIEEENLSVKSIKLLPGKSFNKIVFLLSAVLFQLAIFVHGMKLLRKHQQIILHINDFNTILGAILLKLLFPHRIKTIYDCHELTPAVYSEWYSQTLGNIIGRFERVGLRFTDEIITVSPPIKNYLEDITNRKIHLIWNYPSKSLFPNLTKEEARKKIGIKNDDFLIVYVGSLRLDIALPELIASIKILQDQNKFDKIGKNLQVVIVGDGPLYEKLVNRVKRDKTKDKIHFTGRVERELSLTHLIAADLSYILFTVKGLNTKIGMPWKLFESLVTNTPVMLIDNTYAAEYISKRNAGYSVSSSNEEIVAQKLEDVILSKKKPLFDLHNELIWEKQEKEFVQIYLELTTHF